MKNGICPTCGAPVPADAPKQLCPLCLLQLAARGVAPRLLVDEKEVAGRRFGDYELIDRLAEGGMGVVFKAWQISLNRPVALKMIRSGRLASEAEVRRFRTEAEAAARLEHPNILPVFEVGEHEGQQFFSMRFIEGSNLAGKLADFKDDPRAAARLLVKVARAVQFAHQRGILHRDLKPANILLDERGEPQVADFGMAKLLEETTELTLSGAVMGTPAYMAPEQARGKSRDATVAADIYSLGAVLYALLTGRPPFEADNPIALLRKVESDEARAPSTMNRRADRDLDTICLKCLEKEPRQRYLSAEDLARDLERYLNGEPILARRSTPVERLAKWARRRPALATLVAFAHIAVLGFMGEILFSRAQLKRERDTAVLHEQRARENLVRLNLKRADELLLEADASAGIAHLAWVLRQQPTNRVAADRLMFELSLGGISLPVAGPMLHSQLVWSVRFSPDGARVVTASVDGSARVWNARTGTPVTGPLGHPEQKDVRVAEFSPDGTRVVTGAMSGGAKIWDVESGTLLVELPHGRLVRFARFSPDGRFVATASGDRYEAVQPEDHAVKIWNAATGRLVGEPWISRSEIRAVEFSPDSRALLAVAADGAIRLWDSASGQFTVPAVKSPGPLTGAQFTRDGTAFVFGGSRASLTMTELPTGTVRSFRLPGDTNSIVRLSPDGSRLVATTPLEGVARLVEVAKPDGPVIPFSYRGMVYSTEFSPDSCSLVAGCFDHLAHLWDATSAALANVPLRSEGAVHDAVFSPDGSSVATASADHSAWVWTVERTRANFVRLEHPGIVAAAHASPDRSHFATVTRNGRVQLWRFPAEKIWESSLNRTSLTASVSFNATGDRLAASVGAALGVWETETGRAIAQFDFKTNSVTSAEFHPDGARLLVAAPHEARYWKLADGSAVGPAFSLFLSTSVNPLGLDAPRTKLVGRALVSRDGNRLVTFASGWRDGLLWDGETNRLIGPPGLHANYAGWAEFSPDGKRLVTASADKTAAVWDAATGAKLRTLAHGGWVHCARFDAAGRRIITGAQDGLARIWDAETGRLLTPPLQHQRDVTWTEFSADGRRVATASLDRNVRVWDAVSGQPLTGILRQDQEPLLASFNHTGTQLLIVRKSGTSKVIYLPQPPLPVPGWLADLAEAVGGQQVGDGHEFNRIPPTEVLRLRGSLPAEAGDDYFGRWVHWFFADRAKRPTAFSLE